MPKTQKQRLKFPIYACFPFGLRDFFKFCNSWCVFNFFDGKAAC